MPVSLMKPSATSAPHPKNNDVVHVNVKQPIFLEWTRANRSMQIRLGA